MGNATTVISGNAISRVQRNNSGVFPENFLFGAATAAYQIEGAWNVDGNLYPINTIKWRLNKFHNRVGKAPSIWDDLVHKHPDLIVDHETGDVGADSYHFFEDDISALKAIGVSEKYKMKCKIVFISFVSENSSTFIDCRSPGPESYRTDSHRTQPVFSITAI